MDNKSQSFLLGAAAGKHLHRYVADKASEIAHTIPRGINGIADFVAHGNEADINQHMGKVIKKY